MIIGGLLIVSWIRGVFLFGLETSTNELRSYLYFFATLFYTITLKFSQELLHKIIVMFGLISCIVILVAIVRWILIGLNIISSTSWIAPNGWTTRVISAGATFVLLQMLIIIFYKKNSLIAFLSLLIVLPIIIGVQHRTIWVALVVSIILLIIITSKIKSVSFLGFLLIFVFILYIFIVNNFSLESFSGTSLDLSTFSWRFFGWEAVFSPERFQSYFDYFIGQPLGTGYLRYIPEYGYETAINPHNFYIQTFLNIGGFGLMTLITLYSSLLIKLWKFKQESTSIAIFLIFIAQLVFFVTYTPGFEQGFILGLGILFATQGMKNQKS